MWQKIILIGCVTMKNRDVTKFVNLWGLKGGAPCILLLVTCPSTVLYYLPFMEPSNKSGIYAMLNTMNTCVSFHCKKIKHTCFQYNKKNYVNDKNLTKNIY